MSAKSELGLIAVAGFAIISHNLWATDEQKSAVQSPWAVAYGKEFWRRAPKATPPARKIAQPSAPTVPGNVDLGDIIERVSHAISRENSAEQPEVRAKTYTARFGAEGMCFSPHRPANRELPRAKVPFLFSEKSGEFPLPVPETEVKLRTRLIRLGEHLLYERGKRALDWVVYGNTAQALLNEQVGLIEHCEAGNGGIELSWVLRGRPEGEGELRIELEMDGLSYAGTTNQGLHLADYTGTARVRIGKAVAVDSAGKHSEVMMSADGRSLVLEVGWEFLARAMYPLAIDSLVSPEFGMDEPVTVPRPGEHAISSLAWNGTNWLAVWVEWPVFDSPVEVVGARISKEGAVLDPFGILISHSELALAIAPSVASNGKDYLVVWEHYGPSPARADIHGVRVTGSGHVSGPGRIMISDFANDQTFPAVAGDSEGYLVVWQDLRSGSDLDIYATRVSNAGDVLDRDGFPISTAPANQSQASISQGPHGFLVAWNDLRQSPSSGYDVFGARLDTNRTILEPNGIPICVLETDQLNPSVAANSNGYLVVWQDARHSTTNAQDIYGTLVTVDGEVSHPQGIAIAAGPMHQRYPAVAGSTNNFLVVWDDSRAVQPGIYASRIDAAGIVLDPGGVVIDSVPGARGTTVSAFDDGFLAVWFRSSNPAGGFGSAIWGARLNDRAEVIDPQPILVTAKANDESSPAIASNGTNWLVVWQDFRNLTNGSDIYGVRIGFDGTAWDTVAIPISTQPGFEMAPAVATAGEDYLVVWTDSRNFGSHFYDIYGARVRGDGTVMDPGGVAICTAADFQFNSAVTSDGTNYLVVWQDGRNSSATSFDIYASRVDRSGVVLEPDGFPISAHFHAQAWPAAAFNGKNFLVVWTQAFESVERHGDIWGARVGTDGSLLDPATKCISCAANAQNLPAVASAGSDFLVVWADTRNTVTPRGHTYGGHIYGTRVSHDGTVLEPEGMLIGTVAFRGTPALSYNGTDYLAVWDGSAGPSTNREIRSAWIEPGGRVLLRDVLVNTNGWYPVVAAGATNEFLVVGYGKRNEASRVFWESGFSGQYTAHHFADVRCGVGYFDLEGRSRQAISGAVQREPEDADWLNLEPVVTATSIVATFRDSDAGQNLRRFYRVLQLP